MKSLHTRLDPIKDRVLRFTELFGRVRAMEEFGVSTYDRFSNWLTEVTGNENFGLNPKFGHRSGQGILNEVATKVVRTLLDLQGENEELRKELAAVKRELSHDNGNDMDQALAIMQVCQA